MTVSQSPCVFSFPADPAATDYAIFPAALEDDPLVLFHATPARNHDAIVQHGFKIPDPTGRSGLASVSFAKGSAMALGHAMTLRQSEPGEYCIFAVRYETLDAKCLKNNHSDIHDYALDPQPEILGCCLVPVSYRHL